MIQLRLTLAQGPATAPDRVQPALDLRVSAPTGTSARQLLEAVQRFAAPTTSGVPGRPRGWLVDGLPVAAHSEVGLPPLLDGAVLSRHTGRPTGRPTGSQTGRQTRRPLPTAEHGTELHVVTGPDAGAAHVLTPGLWSVGRDPGAAVHIDDPDVSRWHLELRVTPECVEVRDTGSTNGTTRTTAPEPLGTAFAAWSLDDPLHLGSSVVALRQAQRGAPAALTADGAGHLLVNRGPRIAGPREKVQLDYPPRPVTPEPTRLPWPAILLPLLLAVPVAVLWHQPTFLLIGLLSPLLAAGQYLMDRRSRNGRAARDLAAYRERCTQLDDELAILLVEHAARRHEDHPDLAAVAGTAHRRDRRLWERGCADDDVLDLRLGRGTVSADVVVRRDQQSRPAELADVPVTADLAGARVVGVCGPPAAVRALARSLVGQAAVWHSPARPIGRGPDDRTDHWRALDVDEPAAARPTATTVAAPADAGGPRRGARAAPTTRRGRAARPG